MSTTAAMTSGLGPLGPASPVDSTRKPGRTEIGRPFSRPIQDQQLVLDEHGFGHHSAGTAGPSEPNNGRQQMQKQNGQIAHRLILPSLRRGKECSCILEFAMHTHSSAP
jgi:hypothetical protein